MPDILLTTAEVARRLNVKVETVYTLIQTDNLSAAKIGRQGCFAEAAITCWLSAKMRPNSSANKTEDSQRSRSQKRTRHDHRS